MELTKRQQQVASLIQEELNQVIVREGLAPIGTLVTITEVYVSPDIEHATISFSIFPTSREEEVIKKLRWAVVELQHYLNKRLHMHFVPQLFFKVDTGVKKGAENDEKIAEILKE